jgi:hypothetical protein
MRSPDGTLTRTIPGTVSCVRRRLDRKRRRGLALLHTRDLLRNELSLGIGYNYRI